MMEQQQIDHFRKRLQAQRGQVLAEVANHQLPTDPINDIEEKADRAASNMVETQITQSDENLLNKIEFALSRLNAGTYQECDHCRGEIQLPRLEAKPSVSLCLSCQEKKDSGQI
ncbi:TraR/DksA family transcriptional regulator [Haloferula sp.]|uniref:TraR/DksA family transcriptional regulator n=1 Tax=Haloferula sp. TaxID=2497595 RepID=UPI00329C885C